MLSITVDILPATRGLTEVQVNQIPFALSKAINDTAKQFQALEFAHLQSVMTLRRPDWVQRSIKIGHFATKAEPWGVVAISPPGSTGFSRRDILTKFEDETDKRSRKPGGMVAVPLDGVKRNRRDIIPMNQRPASFHFRQVGNRILGDRGAFIVKTAGGRELILQRSRGEVRALYLLVPDVHITPDLMFTSIALSTVERFWAGNFSDAFELAMRTAK